METYLLREEIISEILKKNSDNDEKNQLFDKELYL